MHSLLEEHVPALEPLVEEHTYGGDPVVCATQIPSPHVPQGVDSPLHGGSGDPVGHAGCAVAVLIFHSVAVSLVSVPPAAPPKETQ